MLEKIKEKINSSIQKVEMKISTNKTLARVFMITTIGIVLIATPAYAAPAVGQNGATYILEQVSWLILAAAIALAVKQYTKGNTVKMLVVAAVGGIIFVLCKNPTKIQSFGTWFFEILGI